MNKEIVQIFYTSPKLRMVELNARQVICVSPSYPSFEGDITDMTVNKDAGDSFNE